MMLLFFLFLPFLLFSSTPLSTIIIILLHISLFIFHLQTCRRAAQGRQSAGRGESDRVLKTWRSAGFPCWHSRKPRYLRWSTEASQCRTGDGHGTLPPHPRRTHLRSRQQFLSAPLKISPSGSPRRRQRHHRHSPAQVIKVWTCRHLAQW